MLKLSKYSSHNDNRENQLQKNENIISKQSPRRKELLGGLDIPYEVHVIKGIDESYPKTLPAKDVAEYIAQKKASAYTEFVTDDTIVLTADTVVVVGEEIMGKPHDRNDAYRMLSAISGSDAWPSWLMQEARRTGRGTMPVAYSVTKIRCGPDSGMMPMSVARSIIRAVLSLIQPSMSK